MSKTEEELWSRFLITNYGGNYLEESDVLNWKYQYDDLDLIFEVLEIGLSNNGNDLAEVVIKKPGDILRKLSSKTGGNKPLDDKSTYGGKQATKWVVRGVNTVVNKVTFPTNYELVFAKTSELLSGSGWVGNFWLVEGYFFYFPDGFSNMAGLLFKKDDQDRPIMQILIGERAYESYQEKMKKHQWDAINRRLI